MKIFSSYTTGGSYESLGFGYGPGIGDGFKDLILIISRASGAPVIEGAVEFATSLIKHDWKKIADEEFAKVKKAGFEQILAEFKTVKKEAAAEEEVKMPEKEVCTAQIPGIEVMDLEDAVKALWKAGIYAESGMGCTGPIVLMADDKKAKALEILKEAGYVG